MSLKVWDTETGQVEATFRGHTNVVTGLAFDAKGEQIGALSGFRPWKLCLPFFFNRNSHCLCCAPIASCSSDMTIRIWSLKTKSSTKTLKGRARQMDGERRSFCDGFKFADLFSARHLAQSALPRSLGHEHTVSGVLFAPNGASLISCSYDKTIRFWDLNTGFAGTTLEVYRVLGW